MANKTMIAAIMTKVPVVANETHKLSQVLRLFTEFHIHHLPIVDNEDMLIGIISSNDIPKLIVKLAGRLEKLALDLDVLDKEVNLKDIMTADPTTVPSTTIILEAAEILKKKKFMSLPVVDNGQLVGIVTLKDILAFMA